MKPEFVGLIANALPLHVEVRYLGRDANDRGEHRVEFGIVGVDAPAGVVISSEMYRNPIVKECVCSGGLDLSDRLMDSFAIACFRVVACFILEQDGRCGSWTARDISRWVRRHWAQADADQILRELARHVTPGLSADNVVVISDDDNT